VIQKSTSLENGPSWLGRFLFGVLVAAAYLANPFEWKHAISAELRDKYVLCNVLMYLPPPPQSCREAIAKVSSTNLQGNRRQKSIPTTSHVVNGSNCPTQLLVEECRVLLSGEEEVLLPTSRNLRISSGARSTRGYYIYIYMCIDR
jgi:hypothetical protein